MRGLFIPPHFVYHSLQSICIVPFCSPVYKMLLWPHGDVSEAWPLLSPTETGLTSLTSTEEHRCGLNHQCLNHHNHHHHQHDGHENHYYIISQVGWTRYVPVRSSEKMREGKQKGAQPHNCHLKVNDLGLTVGCKHLGLLCFSRHVMASKLMIRNSPSTALTVPQNNLLTLEMYKIRDGFTKKSCYSFGFCSNDGGEVIWTKSKRTATIFRETIPKV